MRKILVTGATGTLGKKLVEKLLDNGDEVWGMSRSWEKRNDIFPLEFHPITGDITQDNLGLKDQEWQFDAVYHLAGVVNLSPVDKDEIIMNTNCDGTCSVVKFCKKYNIPHLYYCSTAYSGGLRNPYERSKSLAEIVVNHTYLPKVTVFKPSLVLGDTKQHFSTFVSLLIAFHRRAEIIRRSVEGTLRLPVIEPKFRIHGDENGKLNLVTVDAVATAMAWIRDEGTFWLTHPDPPTLEELAKIVGKFCLMNLSFEKEFSPTPLEAGFERLVRPFLPYLNGDNFKSDMLGFNLSREGIEKELRKLIL